MKRYFVITHHSTNNEHLNVQDLLPATCKLITGVAVIAIAKQHSQQEDKNVSLYFPQALISDLLKGKQITELFYSYLKTRSTQAESKAFFDSDMLPVFVDVLSKGIRYTCLTQTEQQEFATRIAELLNTHLINYLFDEVGIYEKGKEISPLAFYTLIIQSVMYFLYINRTEVFYHTIKSYKQPTPYECGNISLLINGNDFLLRDYVITANRKVRNIKKEIIPFNEPLEVNSNIHTVFKSNKNSGDNTLTIRIYIEYMPSVK